MDAIESRADCWEDKLAELKDDVPHGIGIGQEDVFKLTRNDVADSVARDFRARTG